MGVFVVLNDIKGLFLESVAVVIEELWTLPIIPFEYYWILPASTTISFLSSLFSFLNFTGLLLMLVGLVIYIPSLSFAAPGLIYWSLGFMVIELVIGILEGEGEVYYGRSGRERSVAALILWL